MLVCINKQNLDIAGGVHVGRRTSTHTGDQGIMSGYASDETEDCRPLTDVRKDGSLWWPRPDGRTQTIEY